MCILGRCKIKPPETWQQLSKYNCIGEEIFSNEVDPLSIHCTGMFFIITTNRTSHIPVLPVSVPPWLNITQPCLKYESE
jgi:hypothetical protein